MTSNNQLDRKGKVICGVDAEQVGNMIDTLAAAEVTTEIDVIDGDGEDRLGHIPEDCGFICQINRVLLGMGNELDEFAWERERLELGEVLVAVPFDSPESEEKIRSIMTGYCQSALHSHRAWTTKVME